MLSNTLTLDDEEAVQKELLALQEVIVSISIQSLLIRLFYSSAGGDKHWTALCSFWLSCEHRDERCALFHSFVIIIPTYLFRTETRGVQQSSCRWVIQEYASIPTIYHPSKSPNPNLRFFLDSSPALEPSCGLFKFRYLPTPPLSASLLSAEFPEPISTPNQLTLSFFFSSTDAVATVLSFSALFANFFARRFLYSSKGSW